jgi:hypothetical protein
VDRLEKVVELTKEPPAVPRTIEEVLR